MTSLDDHTDLLETLGVRGIEFVVIGGCAVAAYGRQLAEEVVSEDLDLLMGGRQLDRVVTSEVDFGVQVNRLLVDAGAQVALLRWRGRDVNLMTSGAGLPSPDAAMRGARRFHVGRHGSVAVQVADPFDLLRNKLAMDRPKDRPHIALLRRFLAEEIAATFARGEDPGAGVRAAERLLEVVEAAVLDTALATRLVALARAPGDFRFLAARAPLMLIEDLLARAPSPETRQAVEQIAAGRGRIG